MFFPGYRTTLMTTVLAAVTLLLGTPGGSSAADAKPEKKDSPKIIQPQEVTYTTKIEPAKAKPGDTVTYTVTLDVDKPWHIYAYVPKQPDEGPRGTQFDFFDPAGLTVGKAWSASEPPHEKLDAAFNNMKVSYHEGEISWSTKLKVPADAKPGKKTLRSQIYFQLCDPKSCKPPCRVTVPDASVTIVSEGAFLRPNPLPTALAGMIVTVAPAPVPAPAPAAPTGELGQAIQGGIVSFLIYSALGGLFAVLMPCVWPMIPITVNFFVKQGEAKHGSPTKLAIAYCLAIIGIFTSIGLAVTAALGASGASQLGGNKWVNLLFGVAFIGLGLSLLGLFEIRLPTSLLNASAQGEGRGGLVGVMFMATTLTITSFTCTAPVVGTLLVASTKGQYFYPVLGLLTFSTVLALPFFVLALMPGLMRKMPRSGDWMNAVKVVGGLVEIALAFKFLNTAEIGFGAASSETWIDAPLVLTIWVITALTCGIYLLGLFRTDHDHNPIQVGPLRMVSGVAFLSAALFLAPALFGNPPQSKFYETIVGILPPDTGKLDAREDIVRQTVAQVAEILRPESGGAVASKGTPIAEPEIRSEVMATSKDPQLAILEEKKFHGVAWGMSYDAALKEAKEKNKPVLIDFTGVFCTNCRTVEKKIMPRPDVVKELRKFVTVALFIDQVDIKALPIEVREELAAVNAELAVKLAKTVELPVYVALGPDGTVLGQTSYEPSNDNFLRDFLIKMQEKYSSGEKVAQK